VPTTTIPIIEDGVWLVPAEVAPGIYRVGQYWAALDAQQEIIDNDLVDDCFSIMVLGSDASYVEINGQAVLVEFLPVYDPIAEGCTDGTFLVGSDIAPGQYRVNPTDGNAYWARLDANLEIIDNDLQEGQSIVVVDASDFALRISGTLEKIG
jgi:hypothetical protein